MEQKIEGWCYNDTESKDPNFTEWSGPYEPVGWREHPTRLTQPATLIIGGKALTEEEHEAEFQRRATNMLLDMRGLFVHGSAPYYAVVNFAKERGFTLP